MAYIDTLYTVRLPVLLQNTNWNVKQNIYVLHIYYASRNCVMCACVALSARREGDVARKVREVCVHQVSCTFFKWLQVSDTIAASVCLSASRAYRFVRRARPALVVLFVVCACVDRSPFWTPAPPFTFTFTSTRRLWCVVWWCVPQRILPRTAVLMWSRPLPKWRVEPQPRTFSSFLPDFLALALCIWLWHLAPSLGH